MNALPSIAQKRCRTTAQFRYPPEQKIRGARFDDAVWLPDSWSDL